jgi:hypothetical protein
MNFFHAVASAGKAGSVPAPAFVTSDLHGYWDALPANQGSPWPDLSPTYNPLNTQLHPLSLINSPVFTTAGGADCLYVNGVNQSAVWVNNAAYGTADNYYIATLPTFTHEYWIRSNGNWLVNGNIYNAGFNVGSRGRFISATLGTSWFYNLGMLAGGAIGGNWLPNVWYHYCVTMENLGANDRFNVYRNGVLAGQDLTGNYNPTYAGANFYLGTYSTSEYQRIYYGLGRRYGRALTAAEVLQNFNAEKARFGY